MVILYPVHAYKNNQVIFTLQIILMKFPYSESKSNSDQKSTLKELKM